MSRLRRPSHPGPAGTAGIPQPSTSRADSQVPLASSSSTPLESPAIMQQPASNALRNRYDRVKDDALDLAVTAVGVGKDVAGVVSVPGLAPGLSAFLEILKKIQVMSETAKGVGNLKQDTEKLVKFAKGFAARNPGKELPKALQETIDELTSKWTEAEKKGTKIASRSRFKRFLTSASDAKKLAGLVGDISSSIQHALLWGEWDIQLAVGEVQQKLNTMADQQDEQFLPPHAESAAYDAISARPREPCLEGTREVILEDSWTWVKLRTLNPAPTDNTQGQEGALVSTEETQGFIHWTCGLAGTGKTTIACSVAKRCKEEGILAASFFFSRFDSKCDNPRLLFTTISRQLCRVYPEYRAKVVAIMKNDPDIVNSVPAVQFEKLILEPLEQLTEPFPRLALVIDALDECRGGDSTTIFYILSRFKERIARFFVFIMTSRPETEIVGHFDQTRSGPLGEVTTRLFLHTVQLEPVLRDINRFLTHHLKGTVGRRFPRGRPSDEDIATLADLSRGLFIFARTTVNLLTDKKSVDPVATLERIVQRQSNRSDSVSILDELYRQVLDEAHPNAAEEVQDLIRRIVGTLLVAAEPLSVTTLAALLSLPEHVVRNVLSELYSVLHIPNENSQPIHFVHPTFPEFLLQASPAPPLPSWFSFDATEQHCAVLVRCLMTTEASLRYDIVDLTDPCIFKKEVPDLTDRIQRCIPSHLSYACRNWIVHFTLGSGAFTSTAVHTLFSEFLCQRLPCWLEVCSLLNTLNEVPAALDAARHTCQLLEDSFANLIPFLLDARRFTLTYAPCINTAPLQVYHSALRLAPSSSLVLQAYSNMRLKKSLAVCRGALPEWGPALDSFVGHSYNWMYAVTFSPNNAFFVSGGDDGMVKIWQASTRTSVLDIQTSSRSIQAVAYSPSGLHIAAGGDKGLSIWHAASGAQIRVITGDDIGHVEYTADGSLLLSVSLKGKVQLWQVSDGECLLSLDGDGWKQAGISPNGAVIAFIRGASLLLHDVSSGKHESLELPDQGFAATFSPDGRHVAAATDRAIRIWSHQDKSLLRSIDIDAFSLSRLSFSPDGSSICCGDDHGPVHVWPVEGDGPARELKGHTGYVKDVAWSPDGSQIVSAGQDGTIRLWDVSNHLSTGQPNVLSDRPSSGPPRVLVVKYQGSFMILDLPPQPSADLLLSSSDDSMADNDPTFTSHLDRAAAWDHVVHSRTVRMQDRTYRWAALTEQNKYSSGTTVAISNDGSLVAYAVDRHICIRDLTTGELVSTLTPEFKSGDIRCIVFSPDDSLLASGSEKLPEFIPNRSLSAPGTVAVWNITATACIAYHHDHSHGVDCVTFSSDGRFVVSASSSFDDSARVFDISTKQATHVLEHHDILVTQVMLTTDDRLLVTQDSHGALYIWNIDTGSRIAFFPSSDEFWITTLDFSPTGFSVSTEDGEHTVELWKVGRRAWPVYYISMEGWVYAKGPGYTRRLAWLPPEWRYPVCSDGATFCVCEVDRDSYNLPPMRKLVELDMSRLLDYVGILYNK